MICLMQVLNLHNVNLKQMRHQIFYMLQIFFGYHRHMILSMNPSYQFASCMYIYKQVLYMID
jgi:hypothetical protein